jgi:hypothetical protein
MLTLIQSLVAPQMAAFFRDLAEESGPSGQICIIVSSPLVHNALLCHPVEAQFTSVEVLKSENRDQIIDSEAQIVVLDSVTDLPLCRTVVMAPTDERLVGSAAKAVLQVLQHFEAMPLIEAFDGPVLTQLRATLRHRGVAAFVHETFSFIECFRRGDSPESTWERGHPNAEMLGVGAEGLAADQGQHVQALFGFLEWVRRVQDPHCYLKALLSCFSYIQSNKNASQASRDLNISRTTLHDHLRLAGEYRIDALLEASRGVSFRAPRLRAKT